MDNINITKAKCLLLAGDTPGRMIKKKVNNIYLYGNLGHYGQEDFDIKYIGRHQNLVLIKH